MKKNKIILLILLIIITICSLVIFVIIDIRIRNHNFLKESNNKFLNSEDGVTNNLGVGYLKFNNVYWNICSKPSCITCIDLCVAKKINGVDLDSFKVLNDNYAIDKNHAYYRYNIMYGVDVNSFKVINSFMVEDKNSRYESGKKIENIESQLAP